MKVSAVIAAGGNGARMSSALPKQFLEIAGKPIVLHTIESILALEEVVEVIIAFPIKSLPSARALLRQQHWRVPIKSVAGGPTRQESVRRGVARTRPDADLIIVHDAVRPLCDCETMQRVLDAAVKTGSAAPALPATETIQRVSRRSRMLTSPPREQLYAIQTPQAFRAKILRSSLKRAHKKGFLGTDESSVVRWAGYPVTVVPGSPNNIKITRPLDLHIAESLISERFRHDSKKHLGGPKESGTRIGQGIDYHRLIKGRKLILGGVEIPFEKGLEGHSDADALSHAICDALLGAAALGDLGQHFPDSDGSHRNRSSLEFLQEVRAKVENLGWTIHNVDATLLVQKPKLAPHVAAMKSNIADSLRLSMADVSIKCTTTEGMNAEGQGKGISAQAVVLLQKKLPIPK